MRIRALLSVLLLASAAGTRAENACDEPEGHHLGLGTAWRLDSVRTVHSHSRDSLHELESYLYRPDSVIRTRHKVALNPYGTWLRMRILDSIAWHVRHAGRKYPPRETVGVRGERKAFHYMHLGPGYRLDSLAGWDWVFPHDPGDREAFRRGAGWRVRTEYVQGRFYRRDSTVPLPAGKVVHVSVDRRGGGWWMAPVELRDDSTRYFESWTDTCAASGEECRCRSGGPWKAYSYRVRNGRRDREEFLPDPGDPRVHDRKEWFWGRAPSGSAP